MLDYYIGIDPGTSSAITILDKDLNIILCEDIPLTKNRRGGNIIDLERFLKFFYLFRFGKKLCGIEDVWGQPVQGAKSAGSFMCSACTIRTALRLTKTPFVDVVPAEWKNYYGLRRKKGMPKDGLKKMSVELMCQLYPTESKRFKSVSGSHNMAESALIARYVWAIHDKE